MNKQTLKGCLSSSLQVKWRGFMMWCHDITFVFYDVFLFVCLFFHHFILWLASWFPLKLRSWKWIRSRKLDHLRITCAKSCYHTFTSTALSQFFGHNLKVIKQFDFTFNWECYRASGFQSVSVHSVLKWTQLSSAIVP